MYLCKVHYQTLPLSLEDRILRPCQKFEDRTISPAKHNHFSYLKLLKVKSQTIWLQLVAPSATIYMRRKIWQQLKGLN